VALRAAILRSNCSRHRSHRNGQSIWRERHRIAGTHNGPQSAPSAIPEALPSCRADLHPNGPFGTPVDELVDVGVAGMVNLRSRPAPDDTPLMQHGDAIGDLAGAY